MPCREGPHESNNGVEMLSQRWVSNILSQPLMMLSGAAPFVVLRVLLLQLLQDSRRYALIDHIVVSFPTRTGRFVLSLFHSQPRSRNSSL